MYKHIFMCIYIRVCACTNDVQIICTVRGLIAQRCTTDSLQHNATHCNTLQHTTTHFVRGLVAQRCTTEPPTVCTIYTHTHTHVYENR